MNAHSSDQPIRREAREDGPLAGALAQTLPTRRDLKAAVAGVMREHRRRSARLADRERSRDQAAVEVDVITRLYGDEAARHRAFDTQPSHPSDWAPAPHERAAPSNRSSDVKPAVVKAAIRPAAVKPAAVKAAAVNPAAVRPAA
jgi:hypothetical protein